jgi:hypothetical protein
MTKTPVDELSTFLTSLSSILQGLARQCDEDFALISSHLIETVGVVKPELSAALQRTDGTVQMVDGIAEIIRSLSADLASRPSDNGDDPILIGNAMRTIRLAELKRRLSGKEHQLSEKPDDDLWD